jgi:hypothetical protein
VDDLLTYICETGPWVRQVISKAFDLILIEKGNAAEMETRNCDWRTVVHTNEGGHMKFIDSTFFLPFLFRKLSGGFGLIATKGLYPHYYFNTRKF